MQTRFVISTGRKKILLGNYISFPELAVCMGIGSALLLNQGINGIGMTVWYFMMLSSFCLFAASLLLNISKNTVKVLGIYCIIWMIILLSTFLHPELIDVIRDISYDLGMSMFLGLAMFQVNNYKLLYRYMRVISALIIISAVIFVLFGDYSYESMTASVSLVIPCIVFCPAFSSRKMIDTGLMFLSLICLFVAGSRSYMAFVLLVYLFLIIKRLIREKSWSRRAIILSVIIVGAFSAMIMMDYATVAIGLSDAYSGSRIVEMLVSGRITDLSSRQYVYQACWESIQNHPWVGTGIGSDRLIGSQVFHTTFEDNYVGVHAHNGIIECATEFGIPAAVIFTIFNIYFLVFYLRHVFSKEEEAVLSVLLGSGLLRVVVGGSYWTTPSYWCFMVMVVLLIKRDMKFSTKKDVKKIISDN